MRASDYLYMSQWTISTGSTCSPNGVNSWSTQLYILPTISLDFYFFSSAPCIFSLNDAQEHKVTIVASAKTPLVLCSPMKLHAPCEVSCIPSASTGSAATNGCLNHWPRPISPNGLWACGSTRPATRLDAPRYAHVTSSLNKLRHCFPTRLLVSFCYLDHST